MAGKIICWATGLEQNGLQVFLETEACDGAIGVVCEEWVRWEFSLRASEM